MRTTFVETDNFRRFVGALKALDERGAEEACLVVIDGKPGLGKTKTLSRWVSQTGSIYLRAQKGWDYSWFIQELLAELSIEPKSIRGRRDKFKRVLEELKDRSEAAALADKVFGVVIDECDMISRRPEIMEAIRGISDLRFLPIILVGMGTLRDDLRRFPQIDSRAPNKVEFLPLTFEDTQALISGLCEVPVADDLVEFVRRASKGYSREILDAIKAMERFGRRIELGDEGLNMADMAGQVILSDRASGKSVVVPRSA